MNKEKVYKYIVIAIAILSISILALFVYNNVFYLIPAVIIGIVGYKIRNEVKRPLLLISIFLVTGCFIVRFVVLNILDDFFRNYSVVDNFMSLILAFIVLLVSFFVIYKQYVYLMGEHIKRSKNIEEYTQNRPHLICKEHLTRTETAVNEGYIKIRCRIGKYCGAEKKLIYAKLLIGIVGKKQKEGIYNEDYYVNLWDHKKNTFRDGDYDIIEIYQNDEIKDYDSVMAKIISNLYNSVISDVPIGYIQIKFFGSFDFSKNTQRLLKKYFPKIEYAPYN